MSTCELSFSVS